MNWKSFLLRPYAARITKKIAADALNAVNIQKETLLRNVRLAENTAFGQDHNFKNIRSVEDYQRQVPLRHYQSLKPYVERFLKGEENVLWPNLPKYIVGTAGTTGGIKHIPLSKESMPYHMKTAIHAGMSYAYKKDVMDMFDGKLIFLTGTPQLDKIGDIPTGRLSGIVNHEIPSWLKKSQVPSYETNSIIDWNKKVEQIALETKDLDMRMISGIPPWIVMYLEKLLEISGKDQIIDLFPNLRMMIHGGVNYKPYQAIFRKLIGKDIHFVETYPSTEAFVAFQDESPDEGLLLNANGGVFFEFVPLEEIDYEEPSRLTLDEIELNRNYALIINNNAGLWGSIIGDTIKFVSKNPYRLIFSGRISQYLSAFGEHILASDVDEAMSRALSKSDVVVKEFTVAPYVTKDASYHHWLIEFEKEPGSLSEFSTLLDSEMQKQNFHYKDLVEGRVIAPLKITELADGSFNDYLKSKGKLGGQNKVPRISNDHQIAEELLPLI